MKTKACTPGVYMIQGQKGIRIGQSLCTETRIPQVASRFESCMGKVRKDVIPISDKKARLCLERTLIDMFAPKCNLIRR